MDCADDAYIMTAREINVGSVTDGSAQYRRDSCQWVPGFHSYHFACLAYWQTDGQTAVVRLQHRLTALRHHSLSLPLSFSPYLVCWRQRCGHVEVIHAESSALEIPIRLTVAAIFWWITYSLLHKGMLPIFLENLLWMSFHSRWISFWMIPPRFIFFQSHVLSSHPG